MKVSTGQLARRYATALFESVQEEGGIEKLSAESELILAVVTPEVENFFSSPTRAASEKSQTLKLITDKLGLSTLTRRTLELMAENNRLNHIRLVFKKVLALSDEHRKIVRAQVKSATQLSPAELESLQGSLSQTTGKTVVVEAETEPQLKAGMVVKIGTRQIDASLKSRLSNLKELLTQGV
jgi:F-type H+-transporting ATPase subunit delta